MSTRSLTYYYDTWFTKMKPQRLSHVVMYIIYVLLYFGKVGIMHHVITMIVTVTNGFVIIILFVQLPAARHYQCAQESNLHFHVRLLNCNCLTGTEHRITSAYYPQTNGLTERFNQTLQTALMKMVNEEQNDWDKHLPAVLFAYRTSQQRAIKMTAFEVMYCR